ncbi:hypothetical protein OY18_13010 (plasmid) [Xylella fastidiosa]|nr:hypothetical protein OY18_13010 [Xylella fastidiosa]
MKKAIGGAVAMTILLAGCGRKTDANEKNFGTAVGQYLDKKGDLCLNITKWPVDVNDMDLRLQKSMPTGTAGRMAALEAVGLAKSEYTEVQGTGFDGKPTGVKFKVKRYALTDAAKPFERQQGVERVDLNGRTKETQTDLCWGKKALDKVVKWEGPMKFGDYQEANVKYLYKIDGLADWAKKPEILAAFPYVGQITEDAGKKEQQHGVKLTSVGWEAKGAG